MKTTSNESIFGNGVYYLQKFISLEETKIIFKYWLAFI